MNWHRWKTYYVALTCRIHSLLREEREGLETYRSARTAKLHQTPLHHFRVTAVVHELCSKSFPIHSLTIPYSVHDIVHYIGNEQTRIRTLR